MDLRKYTIPYIVAKVKELSENAGAVWGNITGNIANQTDLQNALSSKQDTLQSGTNIKTINNQSLLGSGDISVGGGTFSGTLDDVPDGTTYKRVTQTEKNTWNSKADGTHTHAISDVTNLQTTLNNKADSVHSHIISDVINLQTTLDGKANSTHNHTISDVTNLQSTLDSKANSTHSHIISDITNLQTTLDGKASVTHNHNLNDLAEKSYNSLTDKPDLSSLHTHANKALLDTYTQTEANLADAVSKKHNHSNQTLLDSLTNSGDGNSFLANDGTYKAVSGGGSYDIITAMRQTPFIYTDFLGPAGAATIEPHIPFDVILLNSAVQGKIPGELNHPGILRIYSSTTANSGAYILTDTSAFLLSGNEFFELIFQHRVASGTNTTLRFGYLDTTNFSDAVDGAYFEVPANSLALVGKTASNSVRSTTGTSYTLTINTWYRARLILNDNATLVTFYLYDDNGTLLWSNTLATNIPTAAGRETGAGLVITNAGTTQTLLAYFDWMAAGYLGNRKLTR